MRALFFWLLVFCVGVIIACAQNTDSTSSEKILFSEQNSNPNVIVQFSTPTPIAIPTQVLLSTSTQLPNAPTSAIVIPLSTTTPATVVPSPTTTLVPKKEIIFSESPYSQAVANYLNIAPQLRLGNPDAPIYLWIHEDFRCPYCQRFAINTVQKLIENYVDTGILQIVFVNTPKLGLESDHAANASLCAAQQDKFWEYKDVLYSVQNKNNAYTEASLSRSFSNLSNSTIEQEKAFDQCLLDDEGDFKKTDDMDIQSILNAGINLEKNLELPIRGVPWSLVVVDKYYEFDERDQYKLVRTSSLATLAIGAHPYETFVNIINTMLKYINSDDY